MDFKALTNLFTELTTGKKGSEETIENIVLEVRGGFSEKGTVEEQSSFEEMRNLFELHKDELDETLRKTFSGIDIKSLLPTSLFYYLEHEDERKNPSWKRRKHRFCPGIGVEKMSQLNYLLSLASLSYADSEEEIESGLKKLKDPYELVYCATVSKPNEPAHFIAVKREQSTWGGTLEVLMVVRGTKSPADAITDLLMDAEDYRGGKAHSGILRAGRCIVEKQTELLEALLEKTKKKRVELTLIGHSLGAGAASIAGIEFNQHEKIDAKVYGFGCPALLSKELSEETKKYITTIVGDSDCIPRMSAATLVNVLLDIMEYDYIHAARRDIQDAVSHVGFLNDDMKTKILEITDNLLDSFLKPRIKERTTERMEPILFPPGTCIHFYRDGSSISASIVPCTFFGELDVSRRLVEDHLIASGYEQIFVELMRAYSGDYNFRFEAVDGDKDEENTSQDEEKAESEEGGAEVSDSAG